MYRINTHGDGLPDNVLGPGPAFPVALPSRHGPLIANTRHVHHMLMFHCPTGGPPKTPLGVPYECGGYMECEEWVCGWAPGECTEATRCAGCQLPTRKARCMSANPRGWGAPLSRPARHGSRGCPRRGRPAAGRRQALRGAADPLHQRGGGGGAGGAPWALRNESWGA